MTGYRHVARFLEATPLCVAVALHGCGGGVTLLSNWVTALASCN